MSFFVAQPNDSSITLQLNLGCKNLPTSQNSTISLWCSQKGQREFTIIEGSTINLLNQSTKGSLFLTVNLPKNCNNDLTFKFILDSQRDIEIVNDRTKRPQTCRIHAVVERCLDIFPIEIQNRQLQLDLNASYDEQSKVHQLTFGENNFRQVNLEKISDSSGSKSTLNSEEVNDLEDTLKDVIDDNQLKSGNSSQETNEKGNSALASLANVFVKMLENNMRENAQSALLEDDLNEVFEDMNAPSLEGSETD